MLVDPFHGGEMCFLEDAEERLNQLFSPRKVRGSRPLRSKYSAGIKWSRERYKVSIDSLFTEGHTFDCGLTS